MLHMMPYVNFRSYIELRPELSGNREEANPACSYMLKKYAKVASETLSFMYKIQMNSWLELLHQIRSMSTY